MLFGKDIIIFKPQIFMNLSGRPIRKIRSFYKINDLKDLILIHDDMDMEFFKNKNQNIWWTWRTQRRLEILLSLTEKILQN